MKNVDIAIICAAKHEIPAFTKGKKITYTPSLAEHEVPWSNTDNRVTLLSIAEVIVVI